MSIKEVSRKYLDEIKRRYMANLKRFGYCKNNNHLSFDVESNGLISDEDIFKVYIGFDFPSEYSNTPDGK